MRLLDFFVTSTVPLIWKLLVITTMDIFFSFTICDISNEWNINLIFHVTIGDSVSYFLFPLPLFHYNVLWIIFLTYLQYSISISCWFICSLTLLLSFIFKLLWHFLKALNELFLNAFFIIIFISWLFNF